MKASTLTAMYPPVSEKRFWEAWSSATVFMRRQPGWISCVVPMLFAVLMGWLDFITGWEVSLFIFYALPITLAVWWCGPRGGVAVALVCGASWWVANESSHPYETQLGYAWALVNRLFYFCVVVFAVSAVRTRQDEDAARIRMLEERRQLERDIVSVSEYEQQRIGQDLHDGLCQNLAAIGCAAHALAEDLRARSMGEARDAEMIEESIRQAMMEARDLARGIFPVHVDRGGLSAALGELARMTGRLTGAAIEFHEEADVHLESPGASMHLYRIAQEAVANAVRHGRARNISITLCQDAGALQLRIGDDGAGLYATRAAHGGEGMGLRTMRYRAQVLGARLDLMVRPGGGTSVVCTVPIQSSSSEAHDQA